MLISFIDFHTLFKSFRDVDVKDELLFVQRELKTQVKHLINLSVKNFYVCDENKKSF